VYCCIFTGTCGPYAGAESGWRQGYGTTGELAAMAALLIDKNLIRILPSLFKYYLTGMCKHDTVPLLIIQKENYRVTTCVENLEMSGNFAVVTEMSGNWPFVRELSGKTIVFNEQTRLIDGILYY